MPCGPHGQRRQGSPWCRHGLRHNIPRLAAAAGRVILTQTELDQLVEELERVRERGLRRPRLFGLTWLVGTPSRRSTLMNDHPFLDLAAQFARIFVMGMSVAVPVVLMLALLV